VDCVGLLGLAGPAVAVPVGESKFALLQPLKLKVRKHAAIKLIQLLVPTSYVPLNFLTTDI
jgi:hypothetical protein